MAKSDKSNGVKPKKVINFDTIMTIKQALLKIQEHMRYSVEHNQPLEYKLWRQHYERLEIIGILLKEIEI